MKRPWVAGAVTLATLAVATDLETLWPHPTPARWTYERVSIEWNPGTRPRDVATVRFELGAPTPVPGGTIVQPLAVTTSATPSKTAFARQLAIARPQLAPRLSTWPARDTSSGLVLHDAAALRVAGDEIAAYRTDLGIRAWLYLVADPVPGRTFDLQLVPDLADSVYLHGRVMASADVSTPAGSFAGAVRVHYEVDYGWTPAVDANGQPVGRTRALTTGEVLYAAGVGPVLARETFVPHRWTEGTPPPPGLDSTFAELRLLSYAVAPTAVESASWSRVKSLFRVP